ncbi:type II toxin-antitoxin system RatA family toxin [Lentibacter sp.]|uniref:type II toxin-antitoxin system RatA family toxin n=1 Tax=Lentibacter sp. TaxID=2024994 RepID=UPI003F694DDA
MPKHEETRVLPYSPEQMYQLVGDVARYPEFLPWCSAARVRSVTPIDGGEEMLADLVIGFQVFRERFGSRVRMFEAQAGVPARLETEYLDGPFKYMRSNWFFAQTDGGCEVRFDVDFEFKNFLLQKAGGLFFYEAMQRIVKAFEARAKELYG